MWKELVRGSDHRAFLALGGQCLPPNTGDSLTNSCGWWHGAFRPHVLGSSLTLIVCSHTTPCASVSKTAPWNCQGGSVELFMGRKFGDFFFFCGAVDGTQGLYTPRRQLVYRRSFTHSPSVGFIHVKSFTQSKH